jgi:amino acid permease
MSKAVDEQRRLTGSSINDEEEQIGVPKHDEIAKGTIWGTTFNTLTCVMGGGVLSLSNAFYNSSLGVGIILAVIFAVIGAFSVYVIAKGADASDYYTMNKILSHALFPSISPEEFQRRTSFSGAELDLAFHDYERKKRRGRMIVNAFIEVVIFFLNFGCLIVYGRVIADSIPPVVRDFLHGSGIAVDHLFWLCIAGAVFFVLTCARTMNELKWTSILGFVTIFYIAVLVVVKCFTGLSTKVTPAVATKMGEIDWISLKVGLFKTVGNLALAYGYHFNVPLFYRELQDRSPKRMMSTVGLAYPLISLTYIMTGMCGYLTFGAMVNDKSAGGNIVNNFSDDDIAVNVGRLGLFFHFCCVYPLLSVCGRQVFHRTVHGLKQAITSKDSGDRLAYGDDPKEADLVYTTPLWIIVIEAFFIVGFSILLAAVVPGIGIVIEVVGVVFGLFVMLTFPGLIGVSLWNPWNDPEKLSTRRPESTFDYGPPHSGLFAGSVVLVVLGCVLQVLGMYAIFG